MTHQAAARRRLDLVAVRDRNLLVGAVHPAHYLPLALGLVWCFSFAAAAALGVEDAGDDDLLLRILAIVGAVGGLPLVRFPIRAAVLRLTDQGVRRDRRLLVRWDDIDRLSVRVLDEDADILAGPVDLSLPIRRIYPVLHQAHHPYEVTLEQLGQPITKRGLRRLTRNLAVLADRAHQPAPQVPTRSDLRRDQHRREEELRDARPRRAADAD